MSSFVNTMTSLSVKQGKLQLLVVSLVMVVKLWFIFVVSSSWADIVRHIIMTEDKGVVKRMCVSVWLVFVCSSGGWRGVWLQRHETGLVQTAGEHPNTQLKLVDYQLNKSFCSKILLLVWHKKEKEVKTPLNWSMSGSEWCRRSSSLLWRPTRASLKPVWVSPTTKSSVRWWTPSSSTRRWLTRWWRCWWRRQTCPFSGETRTRMPPCL